MHGKIWCQGRRSYGAIVTDRLQLDQHLLPSPNQSGHHLGNLACAFNVLQCSNHVNCSSMSQCSRRRVKQYVHFCNLLHHLGAVAALAACSPMLVQQMQCLLPLRFERCFSEVHRSRPASEAACWHAFRRAVFSLPTLRMSSCRQSEGALNPLATERDGHLERAVL